MKTILLSFVLFFSVIAGKHFEVIQAHSEAWTGGAKNSGSGVDYFFKTVISADEHIKFDSLWVDNKVMPLMAVKGKKYDPKAAIVKNDTIMLKASYKHNPKALAAKPPMTYTGAALIGYTVAGVKHYYTVKKIEKKQARPQP